MSPINFLLGKYIKRPKVIRDAGFTMAELLVASIMAVLVITPILGFMVNLLNTDRQEQAKASSEQEIQSAMDYITRDLQQAIYIYDAVGIDAIKAELPSPTATDRAPVLVFWKREFLSDVLTAADNTKDDTFVYSLVAYYLIKDNSNTWSNAARIVRWQIRDGVGVTTGVDCPGYDGKYVSGYCPSSGYAPFSLEGVGTIEQKMNKWKRLSSYTYKDKDDNEATQIVNLPSSVVLTDYIDQTTTTNGAPGEEACVTGKKVTPASFTGRTTSEMTSFYACVDIVRNSAQVFLRGNALARVENSNIDYSSDKNNYFPTTTVRVEGRGSLFTE
ncbi:hormogonium polysaccharide secretion pseudopilin HpsC [Calothrix rhizosoleniae]|uniref:hormogonium polysaccharide secretion pseudopilin HpsC n=1 Tax=Calothrix rhizosoleniae TaxID=888997 RepID=UPI000B498D1D|nr:hormogonium polysaccharide secretion pseudopilin HpsC [Calothrix rhizosoleniae]